MWLSARLDAAEQAARDACEPSGGRWQVDGCGVETADDVDWQRVVYDEGRPTAEEARHIAALDPSWRLADVVRKRAILAEHRPLVGGSCRVCTTWDEADDWQARGYLWPCATVRLLAAEFAGQDGYDEAWGP